MRPLYLMVGFWGDEFHSYFTDYCLPSLLSPRNLGMLSSSDGHHFLVCTTAHDWRKLQELSIFGVLAKHATPFLIECGLPDGSSAEAKFRHMNLGHRLLVNEAFQNRALACQIMPDAMYTDGTIASALHGASTGARAVLTVAMRLREEELFSSLRQRHLLPDRNAASTQTSSIVLKSRAVMETVIESLYDDNLLHDWDGSNFPFWPSFCFWRLPGQHGLLIHSAYFAYILLDMGAIDQHNERSFDEACIENYWLTDNFPDPSLVHIVQDSDDALVVSWTPSGPQPPPQPFRWVLRVPFLSAVWKGFRLRCMREFHNDIGDRQKANNLRFPIRWHAGDIDPDWSDTERRARRVMMWFFGDVYDEFVDKNISLGKRMLLVSWWAVLRMGVKLGPLSQSFRRTLKRLFGRGITEAASAGDSSK